VTTKDKSSKEEQQRRVDEESTYAVDGDPDQVGKPVGPEHDQSFHAPDFYDPKTGKRIETDWDTEAQKNDKGFDPEVMAGTVEQRPNSRDAGKSGEKRPSQRGEGEKGASGGEGGEPTVGRKSS
jgi:hypothetical protein